MAKRFTRYEYEVTGAGDFPVDMLRYDCCWPCNGESAARLLLDRDEPRSTPRRTIRLRSVQPPTVERWASFQWHVDQRSIKGYIA